MAPVLVLPAVLLGASALPPPSAPAAPQLRELGVSGRLPQSQQLTPRILEEIGDPQLPPAPPPSQPVEDLPSGDLGIPEPVLAAYVRAAREVAEDNPSCGLDWSVLASIGRIESGHARDGAIDVDGNTTHPILGPRLNGGPEFASIPDTDGGRFDGDPVWDRAVGPMQFIPSTWNKWAADGNDDGVRSPHNLYDATAAAGDYLCAGRSDLGDRANLAKAVFSYNHSESYVRTVLVWAEAYAKGVTPTPAELSPKVDDVLAGARLPEVAPARPLPPLEIPPPETPLAAPPPAAEPAPSPEQSPEPRPDPGVAPAPPSEEHGGVPPVDLQVPPVHSPDPASGAAPESSSEASAPPETGAQDAPPPESESSPTPPQPAPSSSSAPPAPEASQQQMLSSAPQKCEASVLQSGEFSMEAPAPGTDLQPGTSDPVAASPGAAVFTDEGVCIAPEK